jgi:hypothetical protein
MHFTKVSPWKYGLAFPVFNFRENATKQVSVANLAQLKRNLVPRTNATKEAAPLFSPPGSPGPLNLAASGTCVLLDCVGALKKICAGLERIHNTTMPSNNFVIVEPAVSIDSSRPVLQDTGGVKSYYVFFF